MALLFALLSVTPFGASFTIDEDANAAAPGELDVHALLAATPNHLLHGPFGTAAGSDAAAEDRIYKTCEVSAMYTDLDDAGTRVLIKVGRSGGGTAYPVFDVSTLKALATDKARLILRVRYGHSMVQ